MIWATLTYIDIDGRFAIDRVDRDQFREVSNNMILRVTEHNKAS